MRDSLATAPLGQQDTISPRDIHRGAYGVDMKPCVRVWGGGCMFDGLRVLCWGGCVCVLRGVSAGEGCNFAGEEEKESV